MFTYKCIQKIVKPTMCELNFLPRMLYQKKKKYNKMKNLYKIILIVMATQIQLLQIRT